MTTWSSTWRALNDEHSASQGPTVGQREAGGQPDSRSTLAPVRTQDAAYVECTSKRVTVGCGMAPTFSNAGMSRSEKNVSQSLSAFHHSTTQKPSSVAPAAWARSPSGAPLASCHPYASFTASYFSLLAPENWSV